MAKHEEVKNGVIFPVGDKNDAFATYFVGQSYLKTLVADPKVNVGVGNVTFEQTISYKNGSHQAAVTSICR